ncbi:Drug resistance transporter, EmrB/QacA subfamily OS=Tsukamurella paurometabola (strain ATCC 8368 /DSM / CCUG 35730 / CIP 100753 / JCM 10117 / KCTC 9821/ NBRC 16120 / NCIMB 702349 / NCTC 13040) OX=521096 GN=Tpau_3619 PE=4 SV=1 [Tsukamurella paurometabola]|uniref:Drug resistance transporter, EmrB/QacA subfamily n=1 Tax=Tsukamurella paurometabola (strain ATCC 8368 / DSM 20162 / CCUG 35730 / CIP 100753 / JCM 10117 / KCTC 9821 / NBRC 16120 / NCIMB 702349 / NCTC 13040) TaxID=521096 RepID=D5UXW0_TSUPD|nr:DHA2 family efflux MFS transporter permease subunit [Tsukamurella paurometabola]ADG80197.1 drug resistance transporter, EmrB/QacA subfamily [Tsukamurella paurometabola DSM 20162]SUP38799.1 High-copy suppressor of rspA [Tsukamurella paurometabola]
MSTDNTLDKSQIPHAGEGLDRRVLMVAGVVVLGAIMSILDMTIVGVAQNTFQSQWSSDPATVAWTITGYTLALAAVIPLTGWAADRFGTKRLYMAATAMFVAGSVLCATATSIDMLILFRVIQGLGGGMLMPLGMMILTRAAGPERIGRVMAVLGIPMLLGPIGGPILGGWLIEAFSWHWIFLINLPIGVLAIAYAWFVLPKDEPAQGEKFDLVGFLLLSPGLALFLFGVSSIPEAQRIDGTAFTPRVIWTTVIGLVLIIGFVFWALRAKLPLLDLRLFKNRNMTVAMITFAMFAIAFFGSSILYAQYFIGIRGETTLMAGLLLAPQGLGAMMTMPVAGVLTDKMGPGKFVMTGLALITLGMVVFTQLEVDTSYWLICGSLLVQGLGMGMTMMPTMSAAIRTLAPESISRGSTLTNIVQQVSASIGTAIFSVLFTNWLSNAGPKMPLPTGGEVASGAAAFGQNATPAAREAGIAQMTEPGFHAFLEKNLPFAAEAFGNTYFVAAVLVALCIIPAFFLPRTQDADTGAAERQMVVPH